MYKTKKWIIVTLLKDYSYYEMIWGNSVRKVSFLTNREKQIFDLLVKNDDTDMIAEKLDISSKTVRNHISNVIQKLGVNCRTQAILELIRMNEIKLKWELIWKKYVVELKM